LKEVFASWPTVKIGFSIGDYDPSRELVIDPTLSYSTYLGGTTGIEGPSGLASPGNVISSRLIAR